MAASWNLHLPFDVLGIAPMQRSVAARHAVVIRTTPLGPVARVRRERLHKQRQKKQEDWNAHAFFEMIHRMSGRPVPGLVNR